jgi:hypothetical protein
MYTAAVLIAAGLAFLLSERTTTAETVPPPLNVQQVALFKNGLGFFIGQFACPADKASFQVALPVAPSHGTFWVSYPPDLALTSVVARQVESGQTLEAVTVAEMLRANPGKKVRLVIGDKEVAGTIKYVAETRNMPRPDPYQPGQRTAPADYQPWQPQQASLLILDTENGELSLDPRAVTQAIFVDGGAERRFVARDKSAVLSVQLKNPAPGQKLTVTFLAKGITWAPSYLVDITDSAKARLSAKALILNDACELKDATAQLVTGFPHLLFADIASPMALKEDLAQFLQALSQGQSERGRPGIMSNVMTQRAQFAPMPSEAAMPAYSAAEAGQVAEDLFLYPAGQVNLAKNEVAYIPLFTEAVPYKHIYQWDIPDYVSQEDSYQYRSQPPGSTPELQEVWHSIRLTNSTKVPWTTAPGETVKNGTILGQDTLNYTPAGAQATLRITQAVGIKAEQREFETDRKRDAMQLYGEHFDRVTVRGELSVTSFQDKAVTMEITKTLSGDLKTAHPEAQIEKLATGLRRMNGLLKLTWTLDLPPAQKKDLTYTYEVYVRR